MTSPAIKPKTSHTVDPPFAGKFLFSVGRFDIGAFTEISGLSVQVDVEELAEGGQNAYTHKLMGRMKWPNIVFKRGLTNTDALFSWLMEQSGEGFAKQGNKVGDSADGTISVVHANGKPFRTWSLMGVRPVRWTGPRLAASSRDLAIEELEVCHLGFRVS